MLFWKFLQTSEDHNDNSTTYLAEGQAEARCGDSLCSDVDSSGYVQWDEEDPEHECHVAHVETQFEESCQENNTRVKGQNTIVGKSITSDSLPHQ